MAISGVTCSFHWGRDGFGAEAEEAVVDGMASLGDIEAVDFVGKDEIYDCLDPEGTVFGGDVGESGSHGIHPHKATDAEGGREEPRHTLPESRMLLCGHDTPDIKRKGTDVNTTSNITFSR